MGVVMVCGANILTACSNDDSDGPDNPVSICSVGFLTCLAQLLESKGDSYSSLTETAQTIFHHDATGCCRYQYLRTLDWNAQMLEKIRQMNMIH